MKHEQIRAIALPIIYQIQNEKPNELMWIVEWAGVELCTRFLAAINAKAESVAWRTHHDEPMLFPTRAEAVDYCDDDEPPIPLYEHPAIEPAGEVVVTTDETGRCVCVTRQDEDHRILSVIWEAEPAKVDPRCTCDEHGACAWCWNGKRNDIEPAQDEKLRFALENCRLLAARHRKETWAPLILGFCAEGGVAGSPLRDGDSK